MVSPPLSRPDFVRASACARRGSRQLSLISRGHIHAACHHAASPQRVLWLRCDYLQATDLDCHSASSRFIFPLLLSVPTAASPHEFFRANVLLNPNLKPAGVSVQLEPYAARFAAANGLDFANRTAASALQEVCSLAYALHVAAR